MLTHLHCSKGNSTCGDNLHHLSPKPVGLCSLLVKLPASLAVLGLQMMKSIGKGCLQSTESALGSGSIPGYVDGIKRMFVLEVSMHSQGACIEGSKGAVRCWAALMKDDSGPANVWSWLACDDNTEEIQQGVLHFLRDFNKMHCLLRASDLDITLGRLAMHHPKLKSCMDFVPPGL